MSRPLAFLAALLFAAISVSSACMAGPLPDTISFELKPSLRSGNLQLALWDRTDEPPPQHQRRFFRSEGPDGLDLRTFAAGGPVTFALVREAGRIDCAGTSTSSLATGSCRFTPDPGFADYLAAHGIARPTRDEAYALTMTQASRALIEALAAANYPRPDLDELTALVGAPGQPRLYRPARRPRVQAQRISTSSRAFAALHVTPDFIEGLKRAGYTQLDADDIVSFKALDITPEFIASLRSAGYPNLSADEVTQFAALHITPEFIAGFARAGFRDLDVDTLVQLKALNVTPEFIKSLEAHGLHPKTAEQLVRLKAAGLDE